MKFNTAIAAMMSLINEIYDAGTLTVDELKTFITLLNPFAPHITEEMWHELGEDSFLSLEKWPEYDEAKTIDSVVEYGVQICGKFRGTVVLAADGAA
jgi:leucyl-tRNA synthetase